MKYFHNIIQIVSISISFCGACYALPPSTEELSFVSKMSETFQYINENPMLWPEFTISSKPSIIYFANKHNYAFNFLPINPHWIKLQNQVSPVYFLENDEYGINDIAWAYDKMIDHQATYLFKYIASSTILDNIHVLLHERFHMFQFEKFPEQIYFSGTYTGFTQLENVKLSYLEIAALKNYLIHSDINSLQDYVAINQYRQTLIGTESSRYEAGKENIEGLAEYYAWNGMNLDTKSRNDAMLKSFQDTCTLDNLIKCQIHHRYYFTGAVIGIALDQLSPVIWKEHLMKNKVSVREQLYRLFPMNDEQLMQHIEHAKSYYHYETLIQPIETSIIDYQNKLSEQQEIYDKSTGVVFNLQKTPCNLFGMILTDKTYWINSDYVLNINMTGHSSCQDESILVDYNHLPFCYESNEYKNEFKISTDSQIIVDGVTIILQE